MTVDPDKNYLEELVGDGKKFQSVEDLARGKAHSDLMIANLLREKKEALEELQKRLTVEDLLARMEKGKTPVSEQPGSNQMPSTVPAQGSQPNSPVSLDEIKAAIKADLEKESQEATRKRNVAEVVEKLKETLGDSMPAVLQAKAQELGVSLKYLENIAADSPKLFYATLGEVTAPRKDSPFSIPGTNVNTASIAGKPQYGNHKPQSYYAALKAKDKKAYFSKEVSLQMMKDAQALGERFFD
jgi:hypothetical protein